MSSLKVAVVEDEPLARERLSRFLSELGCEVTAQHEDGGALLDWLPHAPTLDGLFLDIQMPGVSGLELVAELKTPLPVIFVTAYAEHAVRAFDAEAVDYILKPVFKDRLERCLTRLKARQVPLRTGAELRTLMDQKPQRILVKARGENVLVDVRKVSHFEVIDEIVWVWVGGKRFRSAWTALSEVETSLPDAGLLRIQRHTLLRRESVQGYRSLPGGRWKVRVAEGLELEVSRTATPKLREMLGLAKA